MGSCVSFTQQSRGERKRVEHGRRTTVDLEEKGEGKWERKREKEESVLLVDPKVKLSSLLFIPIVCVGETENERETKEIAKPFFLPSLVLWHASPEFLVNSLSKLSCVPPPPYTPGRTNR